MTSTRLLSTGRRPNLSASEPKTSAPRNWPPYPAEMSQPACSADRLHSPISTGSVKAITTLSHESNSINRPMSQGALDRSDHDPVPSRDSPTHEGPEGVAAT